MPPKKSSNKESVEALLSDLDSLGTEDTGGAAASKPKAPPSAPAATSSTPDAQSLLDDLDSLVQRRAPTPRRTTTATTGSAVTTQPSAAAPPSAAAAESSSTTRPPTAEAEQSPAASAAQALESTPAPEKQRENSASATPAASSSSSGGGGGGWGSWGSVWSSATKLADQARAELEKRAQSEQAKELGQRGWDIAQGVRGFVKETGWEKLGDDLTKVGKRGWTEVINAVAPPIAAHEVIVLTLSHDMTGFDGVPDVVFKVLSRVMESQVRQQGLDQQLIVNQAKDGGARVGETTSQEGDERDMKPANGFAEGWKTAQSSLAQLIGAHEPEAPKVSSSVNVPVTNSPVFLRIQPVLAPLPGDGASTPSSSASSSSQQQVYFLVLLQDPTHGLSHRTCSQAMPHAWLSLPFDENPWIEQAMVDSLENALAIVAQDYINGRQSGRSVSVEQEGQAAAATT